MFGRFLAVVIGVVLLAFAILISRADARDPTGKYANSPNAAWFKAQHNSQGEWCCDESDGHPFYGEYTFNADGSVTAHDGGIEYKIDKYKVLTGANPTGSPVWWFIDVAGGRMTYCFAPGTLS